MSCNRIAESEESLAARRDDHQPQVGADLVVVSTILLPEPDSEMLLASGVVGLYGPWARCYSTWMGLDQAAPPLLWIART